MGGEVEVRLSVHPRQRWLLVPAEFAGTSINLSMVLDSGSALCSVSAETAESLLGAGVATPRPLGMLTLRGFTLNRTEFEDVRVRVSRRLTEVGADALLGLDFLGRFKEVCIDVPTLVLRLRT